MKNLVILLVALSALAICSHRSVAQTQGGVEAYTLVIVSADANAPGVKFDGSYAFSGTDHPMKLVMVHETTPFQAKVAGSDFLGMFQPRTKGPLLKVSLTKLRGDAVVGQSTGTGRVNIIYGRREMTGYGWPDGRGNISELSILPISHRKPGTGT